MEIGVAHQGRVFELRLSLHPEEVLEGRGQQGRSVTLVTDSTCVTLPGAVEPPHPDLMALAALLVARPWSRNRLALRYPVSAGFAEAVYRALGIEISPIDSQLTSRRAGERLGLMYSGGPDCMAAELLLDQRLPLLHLRRVAHPRIPNRWTRWRPEVIERLVNRAKERGEEVHTTRTDLEFLCLPFPMYPQWASLAIGAVLQADNLSLGGLVTGRNISGTFLRWGRGFDPRGDDDNIWRELFKAVGLVLIQPAAGLSDIATKSLAKNHRLGDLARSCLVGSEAGPCLGCKKCVFAELINAALSGRRLSKEVERRFAQEPKAISFLESGPPYPDQHILEYVVARLPGIDKTIFAEVASRVIRDPSETEWAARYYRPALDIHVPSQYQATVMTQVQRYLKFMDTDDERRVESWMPLSPGDTQSITT